MAKYHINRKGEAALCRATVGECPFQEHFPSLEEAREAFESVNMTFRPNKFLKPRPDQDKPYGGAPFNREGLTKNVEDFKNDLKELARYTEKYKAYRNTGLDEDKYRPIPPKSISPYINSTRFDQAVSNVDTRAMKAEYANALKEFYMQERFHSEDIDCLFDDDAINTIIGIEQ